MFSGVYWNHSFCQSVCPRVCLCTKYRFCQSAGGGKSHLVTAVVYFSFVLQTKRSIYPLPDNIILDLPKLKEFADDKMKFAQNLKRNKFWSQALPAFPILFPSSFQVL